MPDPWSKESRAAAMRATPTGDPAAPPIPTGEEATALRRELQSVVDLRADLARVNAQLADAMQEWNHQHAPLINAKALTVQALMTSEANAKALALAAFAQTGEKRPALGVLVALRTELHYDAAAALTWAKAAGVAVQPEALDAAAFENIVRAAPTAFHWVEIHCEPRAQLATDLEAALAAGEAV